MQKQTKKTKDPYPLVTPEFQEFVQSAEEVDLKAKLVELDRSEQTVFQTRDDDQELEQARDKLKECSEPYTSAIKEVKQKRSLIVKTLQSRGQA